MALSPERISPAFSLRFTSKRTLSSPGPHCPPARQRPGCRPCPDVCSPGACAFSGLPESSARPPGGDGTGGACQVQAFRETQQDAADTPSTSQGSPGRPPPFLEHGSGLESELGGVCVKQEHSRGASSVSPRMLTGHLGFSQAASGTRVTLCSRPTPRLPMVSNQSLTPTPAPGVGNRVREEHDFTPGPHSGQADCRVHTQPGPSPRPPCTAGLARHALVCVSRRGEQVQGWELVLRGLLCGQNEVEKQKRSVADRGRASVCCR